MSEITNKIGLISEGIEKCTEAQIEAIYLIMTGKVQPNVVLKNKKVEVETTPSAAPENKIETIIDDKPQEETKAPEK